MNTDLSPKPPLGQLFFSAMSHYLYDVGLYQFVTPYIWRCPTRRLLDNYVENISHNHLEIGVGSGYFLKRTLCADYLQRLVLLDLNRQCLKKSAKRLIEFRPRKCHHNILLPLEETSERHTSVGMNYVLHCIPGDFLANRKIFAHIHSALEDNGVFFGATLLTRPWCSGLWSWLLMGCLNGVGIFHNRDHTLADLRHALGSVFRDVELSVVGNAAVFRAVK